MLAFRIFDADNKGYIDSAELRYILLNMDKRIPAEELNELMVFADLERDRKISYQGELMVFNIGRSLAFSYYSNYGRKDNQFLLQSASL